MKCHVFVEFGTFLSSFSLTCVYLQSSIKVLLNIVKTWKNVTVTINISLSRIFCRESREAVLCQSTHHQSFQLPELIRQ